MRVNANKACEEANDAFEKTSALLWEHTFFHAPISHLGHLLRRLSTLAWSHDAGSFRPGIYLLFFIVTERKKVNGYKQGSCLLEHCLLILYHIIHRYIFDIFGIILNWLMITVFSLRSSKTIAWLKWGQEAVIVPSRNLHGGKPILISTRILVLEIQLEIAVFWDVTQCSLLGRFNSLWKTSYTYQTSRRYNPDGRNLAICCLSSFTGKYCLVDDLSLYLRFREPKP
jgi:hypothetical protein